MDRDIELSKTVANVIKLYQNSLQHDGLSLRVRTDKNTQDGDSE